MLIKELHDLSLFELSLVLIVLLNGICLINAVFLLGQKLLEGQHGLFLGALQSSSRRLSKNSSGKKNERGQCVCIECVWSKCEEYV